MGMRFPAPALSALTLVVLVVTLGCGRDPTRPRSPGGDDEFPQCAIGQSLVAYQHVAGAASDPQRSGLYVVDYDSTTATPRLVAEGVFGTLDWIPHTDTLVVAQGSGLFLLPISTGAMVPLLAQEAYNPSVSPDGRLVAFDAGSNGRTNLFVLDRISGSLANITPDSMLYQFSDWSPDGQALVTFGATPTVAGIFLISRLGAPLKSLAPSVGFDQTPAWSSIGDEVAWVNIQNGVHLLTADTSGTAPHEVAAGYPGIAWVPERRSIVFSGNTNRGKKLFLLDLPTGNLRQFTF